MKKLLFIIAVAFVATSCENSALEEVTEQCKVEEKKKEDVNFRIFKDRTQSGKGETR